jgi:hypothetical protein
MAINKLGGPWNQGGAVTLTAALNAPLTLTSASSPFQYVTATSGVTVTLPSAATMIGGWFVFFNDDGANTITLAAPAGDTLTGTATVPSGDKVSIFYAASATQWYSVTNIATT